MKLLTIITLFASAILHAQEPTPPAAPAAPAAAPAAAAAPLNATELLAKMAPHLINAKGEKVTVNLKEKDHVLVYWSASWCGPCRVFTPKLVEFYHQNGGGKKFEIVLMSADRTEPKMEIYFRNSRMPWPAVSFTQKENTGAKAFAIGGIPRLMIINKKGEVIARGNGPMILAQFKEIIAKAP